MKTVTAILMLALLAFGAMQLAGCASHRPPEPPAVGNNLGGARALGQFALANVVTLKTHVDADHEPLRQSTANALTEQDARLVAAEKANDALAAQLAASGRNLAAVTQALTDERGHWIGFQLRLAGKWIIGIGLALWAGIGVASAFFPLGSIGSTAIRFLPVANVFAWLRDKIIKPSAPTPA